MNLALAILCLWLGSALLWVAGHGLPSGAHGFGDIWNEVLSGIGGGNTATGGGGADGTF